MNPPVVIMEVELETLSLPQRAVLFHSPPQTTVVCQDGMS